MYNTTKWLVNAAALFVIIFGLKMAAPFVTQVLIIIFLAIIISPIYYLLRKLKFPPWLALTTLILLISAFCIYTAGYAIPRAVISFGNDIPGYVEKIPELAAEAREKLRANNIELPDSFYDEITKVDKASIVAKFAVQTTAFAANFFKTAVLMVIIICFIMIELPNLPVRAKKISWMTESLWGRFSTITLDVRRYMGIKAVVSALTGITMFLGLLALGEPYALLMGVLAFAFNFVPFIGSLIAAVPPAIIPLIQGRPGGAVAVIALYVIANTIYGSIVEPKMMGRGFGVSPELVLISIIFWGWVLGPVGMFFAVPITMAVRVALMSSAKTGGEA